jgi:hypothetical protein
VRRERAVFRGIHLHLHLPAIYAYTYTNSASSIANAYSDSDDYAQANAYPQAAWNAQGTTHPAAAPVIWGAQGCQPARLGSLPRWENGNYPAAYSVQDVAGRAAGNYRLAACAPLRFRNARGRS